MAPVTQRFRDLTNGRYGEVQFGPELKGGGLRVEGQVRDFSALSLGTREQLATIFRLAIAEQLDTALILDDHLSQTDRIRTKWFRGTLRGAAEQIQIVVLTCRALDYLDDREIPPEGESVRTLAGGLVRSVDLERVVDRFEPASSTRAP